MMERLISVPGAKAKRISHVMFDGLGLDDEVAISKRHHLAMLSILLPIPISSSILAEVAGVSN
jgi:hypothetical protein